MSATMRQNRGETTRLRVVRMVRREDVPDVLRIVEKVRLRPESTTHGSRAVRARRKEPEPVAQVGGNVPDQRIG